MFHTLYLFRFGTIIALEVLKRSRTTQPDYCIHRIRSAPQRAAKQGKNARPKRHCERPSVDEFKVEVDVVTEAEFDVDAEDEIHAEAVVAAEFVIDTQAITAKARG